MNPDDTGDDEGREPRPRHHAEITGSASEAVQARDVQGGVHFHHAAPPVGSVPGQLLGDIGGFVNRLDELSQLDDALLGRDGRLRAARIFIISGTAGVGKTSLALHWSHGARRHFPDGQLYVNLRGYDPEPQVDPGQALDRFLRSLGVLSANIPSEIEDKASLYRSLLASRRVLVVLDNAANVRQIRPLLPGNAECLVLVTSRSRLSGLVARDGARRLSLDVLAEQDAVGLLRETIAEYRSHDDEAQLVELARLCARLPLALRIAAERASSRPLMLLSELISELVDESTLWDALTAEDDEDADAVRSVFAWSYRALPTASARLFRLLGLHPGSEFGLPAAAAIAGIEVGQARHLLDALVSAYMLEQRVRDRYQFHDLLRAYAANQAMQQEDLDKRQRALRRVLTWYLHTAGNAVRIIAPLDRNPLSEPVPGDVLPLSFATYDDALGWCDTEHANLVLAIRAAAGAGLHDLAWQLPAVLSSVYSIQNPFDDWVNTGNVGLESARRVRNRFGEAELLSSLGMAYLQSDRLDQADRFHRAALAIRREVGDRTGVAMSITYIGLLAWRQRRLRDALASFEEASRIQREIGDRDGEAWSLGNIGMVHVDLERYSDALRILTEGISVCREVGDRPAEGNALFFLAAAQRELGSHDEALSSVQAALSLAREDGNIVGEGYWLLELARVQRAKGKTSEALTAYQSSAAIQRQLKDRSREAMALDGVGGVYLEIGFTEEAVKFHRIAAAAHREVGSRWNLAVSLFNLATALSVESGSPRAREHWVEASSILQDFDDPAAVRMRDRIDEVLAGR